MTVSLPEELPVQNVQSVRCQTCGNYDASLRYSEHPQVVSTLVTTLESTHVGISCDRCRAIQATRALAITLAAGWWSLRGPKLAVAAIRANLGGGKQPATLNAQMLRALARHESESGNGGRAATFASAAHATQPQRENSRLLEELNRAGHRSAATISPWRYAPYLPIVALALLLGVVGSKMIRRATQGPTAPVAAAAVPVPTPLRPGAAPEAPAKPALPQRLAALSADELEKALASSSDSGLAHHYLRARLIELKGAIPAALHNGDNLWSFQTTIKSMAGIPPVAKLLEKPALKVAYDTLNASMNEATRYYRGGATVEAIQRTIGDTTPVAAGVIVQAIQEDSRNHTERSDALLDDAARRIASIAEQRFDLRLRAAIANQVGRDLDACLRAVDN